MTKITNKKQKISKPIIILKNSDEELRMIEALKSKISATNIDNGAV